MDMKKFNKFMMKFAPMLMQMKMRERGYEAWGETQRRTIHESLKADLQRYAALEMKAGRERNAAFALKYADKIVGAIEKSLEGMDRPGLLMPQRVKEAGIPAPPFEPTVSHEEAIDPYQVLMEDIEKLYGGEVGPEKKDVIARTVGLKGSDFMQKIIEDVAKARRAEEGMKLQARKVTVEEKKIPIREAELKAGGVPKKSALENKLDSKLKERWGIIEKLAKAETEEEWGVSTKATQVLKNRIEQLSKSIRSLKEKTGTDPDERHAKGARFLKSKGYSKKDLLENERVKSWINEAKLTVWILLEYF